MQASHEQLEENAIVDRKRPATDAFHRGAFHYAATKQRFDSNQEGENDNIMWSPSVHRALVEAIFKIGVKNASPSLIKDNLTQPVQDMLTSERIKSHLQKFRRSTEKSADEFMREYDGWIQKALTVGAATSGASSSSTGSQLCPSHSILNVMGQSPPLLGGEAASLLMRLWPFIKPK